MLIIIKYNNYLVMLNLYDILIEEIDRLIEEGKDPIELINYKFKNVPEEVRNEILKADPTKKKSYSQWMLNRYNEEPQEVQELIDNGNLDGLFSRIQKNKVEIKDFNSIEDLYDGLRDAIATNDYEIAYESDEWKIVIPHTYEADREWGKYTDWCTASGEDGRYDGRSMWNTYSSDGTIFINIDKTKKEKRPVGKGADGKEVYKEMPVRYQFLFEYDNGNGMMCDSDDNDLSYLGDRLPIEIGMPEDVIEFYTDKGYDFSTLGGNNLEQREEDYREEVVNDSIQLGELNGHYIELSQDPNAGDDNNYHLGDSEDSIYGVLIDGECVDDDYSYYKDTEVEYIENVYVIVKQEYGGYLVIYEDKEGEINNFETDEIVKSLNYTICLKNGEITAIDIEYNDVNIYNCGDVDSVRVLEKFINNKTFLQVELSSGEFDLINLDDNRFVLRNEVPKNEKFFTVAKGKYIECEDRLYNSVGELVQGNEKTFSIDSFYKDLIYKVKNYDDKYNFFNKETNKLIFPKWVDTIIENKHYGCLIKLNDKWNVTDTNFNILFDTWFDELYRQNEAGIEYIVAVLLTDNGKKYNILKYDGTILFDSWKKSILKIVDDIFCFTDDKEMYYIFHLENGEITSGPFKQIKQFDSSDYSRKILIGVLETNQEAIINKNDGYKIHDELIFDEYSQFSHSNDYVLVKKNGECNILDKNTNSFILNGKYPNITPIGWQSGKNPIFFYTNGNSGNIVIYDIDKKTEFKILPDNMFTNFEKYSGSGVKCTINGHDIYIGSMYLDVFSEDKRDKICTIDFGGEWIKKVNKYYSNSMVTAESLKREFFRKFNLLEDTIKNNFIR